MYIEKENETFDFPISFSGKYFEVHDVFLNGPYYYFFVRISDVDVFHEGVLKISSDLASFVFNEYEDVYFPSFNEYENGFLTYSNHFIFIDYNLNLKDRTSTLEDDEKEIMANTAYLSKDEKNGFYR